MCRSGMFLGGVVEAGDLARHPAGEQALGEADPVDDVGGDDAEPGGQPEEGVEQAGGEERGEEKIERDTAEVDPGEGVSSEEERQCGGRNAAADQTQHEERGNQIAQF